MTKYKRTMDGFAWSKTLNNKNELIENYRVEQSVITMKVIVLTLQQVFNKENKISLVYCTKIR